MVTEKVANFTTGQPPANSFYPILFPTRGDRYIALDATQGLPKFTYGTYQDVANGVLAFTEEGLLDPGSAYAADGTIAMVIPRSLLGNPPIGGVISGFDARTRVGSQSATSRDAAGPSDYVVRGSVICDPAAILLGSLGASKDRGAAPPAGAGTARRATPGSRHPIKPAAKKKGGPRAALFCSAAVQRARISSSTRRFSARPSAVSLLAIGWVSPKPLDVRRLAAMPRLIR